MVNAKYFYKSECDESEKSLFVTDIGWVNNFMRRNLFSVKPKTATVQQNSEWLIDKLILYILHDPRLFN